jgi:hypothetical protein
MHRCGDWVVDTPFVVVMLCCLLSVRDRAELIHILIEVCLIDGQAFVQALVPAAGLTMTSPVWRRIAVDRAIQPPPKKVHFTVHITAADAPPTRPCIHDYACDLRSLTPESASAFAARCVPAVALPGSCRMCSRPRSGCCLTHCVSRVGVGRYGVRVAPEDVLAFMGAPLDLLGLDRYVFFAPGPGSDAAGPWRNSPIVRCERGAWGCVTHARGVAVDLCSMCVQSGAHDVRRALLHPFVRLLFSRLCCGCGFRCG